MALNDRAEELSIAAEDVHTIFCRHSDNSLAESPSYRDAEKIADAILTLATVIRAGQL